MTIVNMVGGGTTENLPPFDGFVEVTGIVSDTSIKWSSVVSDIGTTVTEYSSLGYFDTIGSNTLANENDTYYLEKFGNWRMVPFNQMTRGSFRAFPYSDSLVVNKTSAVSGAVDVTSGSGKVYGYFQLGNYDVYAVYPPLPPQIIGNPPSYAFPITISNHIVTIDFTSVQGKTIEELIDKSTATLYTIGVTSVRPVIVFVATAVEINS